MAELDTNVSSIVPVAHRTRSRPPASSVALLLTELRGVPDNSPPLPEALALRSEGWRLVVAYCRISFAAHRRDGHGVEDQAAHCARIAAQHRAIVVHRYVDNDKSASKVGVTRPDFEDMLTALESGVTATGYPIDGVVCVSDDRLYRDVRTYQRFLMCFKAHPHRTYTDTLGQYDLYGEDAVQRGLLGAAAARAESTKQQQRARLNHRARAERGEPVASRRPFGWNTDKLTLHPGESEIVRCGVHRILGGGSLTAVTQDFVSSGYTTTLGNPWQRQTVKQVLRNPRICGYRKLHGVLVLDTTGKPVLGQWEPIVAPGEWLAITKSLDGRRHPGGWNRTGASRDGARYLLTGLVRCGRPLGDGKNCGASMHGHPTSMSYEYRCRPTLDGGCGRLSRQGPAVDDLITQYALTQLEQHGLLGSWLAPWPDTNSLEIANQRKAALQEKWYAGEFSDSDYFSQLAREEREIKRLTNDRQAWFVKHSPVVHERFDTLSHWDGLSLSEKREILFGLLSSVIILPGTKGSHRFEPTAIVPVWRETVRGGRAA
ncbi:recombinase family protein [Streptomyces sp. NPDC046862]|uniref:recombinase family protein n=1 Tax=Streptomyces sp. NPDC046862 TaxID=3154603 RepID=UPI0034564CF7